MGTRRQSARLRQKTLERLHTALSERYRRLLEGDETPSVRDQRSLRCETADVLDMAASASDREIRCRVAAHHWQELVGIEDAFRKIKDGTYGICEECGAHIRVPRLRAMPYARLCLHCQQTLERCAGPDVEIASWETIGAAYGGESRAQLESMGSAVRY